MKDLYSFHETKDEALNFYEKVKKAYFNIFWRCGFKKVICVKAESGTIGGELSHEFLVFSETGEDSVFVCSKCGFGKKTEKVGKKEICPKCHLNLKKKNCIELGHIFYLGEKYSKDIEANFIDREGKKRRIIMGCYGIGLGRLMASIVEVFHDEKGIIWPAEIVPFQVHLISLLPNAKKDKAEKLYHHLRKKAIEVLYDDRADKSAGEKFIDADLIGIPIRIVISERTLKAGCVELKKRKDKKTKLVKMTQLLRFLN